MKNPFDDSSDISDFVVVAPPAQSPGNAAGGAFVPAVLGAPITVPEEELEAEAAVTASGTGAPGSTVAVGSSAGLTINLIFDNNAMNAPQSFRDGITQAMQMICAVVTDKITLNLQIDWSGTGGGAAGGPSGGNYVSYSTVRADLVNNASLGDTTFNSLPTGSTIGGQSQVAVWYSQEKLWGMISPTGSEIDGSATFATDINPNLLVGVALHELTHAMGRVPYGTQPDIFDFYRFTSAGNYLFNGNATAPAAYFSLDGGTTKIADYGQTSDPSDFLNNGLAGPTDPFDEFYSNNTQQQLTALDLKQLDALGFHLISGALPTTTVIESFGATKLVQVGNDYFFNPVAGGSGPELMYGGAPWAAGQAWAPIGVEKTATGYEVALFNASSHLYTVWNTDSSGNVLAASISGVSGTDSALESIEVSFKQDLNGDGTIGVPNTGGASGTVIEAYGATKLVEVGNNYFFNPVAGGSGPELTYGGTPWVAGTWAPIGAEKTSTGYEVALLNSSTHLYTIWNTDAGGNVLSASLSSASGTSAALESAEVSFQQDLNGDGTIGVSSATVIEAFGATKLVQVGNDYFFNPVAGGSGPELVYGGTPWVAGAWAPIGVEKTTTGYEVALFNASSHLYTVWNTDSSGNVLSAPISGASATSTALESIETSFQQDLNGDGIIGIPTPTVSAAQASESAPAAPLAPPSGDSFLFSSASGFGTYADVFRPQVVGDAFVSALTHVGDSAAPPASFGGDDSFLFRSDPGGVTHWGSAPVTTQQAGETFVSALTHLGDELQHIITAELQDLAAGQDPTSHGPVWGLLHGFIIH